MTDSKLWLVAHDLSPLGDAAAARAAQLASPSGRLLLLHVTAVPIRDPWDRDGRHTAEDEDALRARLLARATELRRAFPTLTIDVEVLAGDPKTRILEEAARGAAAYVVVGTHDRRGLERLLLGSVAEAVVHQASVPVLVVKGPLATAAAAA